VHALPVASSNPLPLVVPEGIPPAILGPELALVAGGEISADDERESPGDPRQGQTRPKATFAE
jgi:hypothetical protein